MAENNNSATNQGTGSTTFNGSATDPGILPVKKIETAAKTAVKWGLISLGVVVLIAGAYVAVPAAFTMVTTGTVSLGGLAEVVGGGLVATGGGAMVGTGASIDTSDPKASASPAPIPSASPAETRQRFVRTVQAGEAFGFSRGK